MFGNDAGKYIPKPKEKEKSKVKDEDDLEAYLKARNATIGEETKSLAESEEDRAMEEYMRLRSKTYDEPEEASTSSENDDLDSYLQTRNETLNENLTAEEREDAELEAYLRERKQVFGE